MTIDTLKRLLTFVLLCLAQALVLNRIQLFGCAMPLLYVYLVISFPRNYPRWASLLWAFAMGVCADMFANTPGVAMTSLTLLAFVQPVLLELFVPYDADANSKVSIATLGFNKFFFYALLMVLLYCLVFFLLEAFSFFNWQHWLECVGGSTVVTLLLVTTLANWGGKKVER